MPLADYKLGMGTVIAAAGTLQGYQAYRSEGKGRLDSALRSYINFQVYNSRGVMAATIGIPLIRKFLIERPQHHIQSLRRSTAVFSHGSIPDSELIGQMQASQMQSATAANSSLRLSGKSFAGMEASVYAGRYG